MSDKYTHYFETTSRIDENCGVLVQLKKRLQGSNNLAWLALSEVQNVYEAIRDANAGMPDCERVDLAQRAISKLDEVTDEHQFLLGHCVDELKKVSQQIADDLDLIEKMSEEKEALSFQNDFKAVGSAVVKEFRKPSVELDEAEELQELMRQYGRELRDVG